MWPNLASPSAVEYKNKLRLSASILSKIGIGDRRSLDDQDTKDQTDDETDPRRPVRTSRNAAPLSASSSSLSSISWHSARSERFVRFDVDEHNRVLATVHDSEVSLTEDDLERAWWTPNESHTNFEETKRLIVQCRMNEQGYMKEYLQLFALCTSKHSLTREFRFSDPHLQRSVRGLERYIHDVSQRYKAGMISAILDIQAKLPKDVSTSVRTKILASKSLQLSRPSRVMSRYMGKQDELEVLEYLEDEFGLPDRSVDGDDSTQNQQRDAA